MATNGATLPVAYFAAGPSKLPEDVMKKAQKEFVQYESTQVSVMELSHRSPDFMAINDACIGNIKKLLDIPDTYKIVLLQGGGTGQFAAVPLNLLPENGEADYLVTGTWSEKSFKEAKKYGKVNNVCQLDAFTKAPNVKDWKRSANASYLYYCDNETIHGVEFPNIAFNSGEYSHIPVVADMSSNFMTRYFDITRYGMIFAAAQKNIGPAGATVVIIREDLLGKARSICPMILDYAQNIKNNSLLNTPVTYSVYMTNLVLGWIQENGGLEEIEKRSKAKSKMLYDAVANSNGFYTSNISPESRSRCNVCFTLRGGDEKLEAEFLSVAKTNNLLGMKGHRSVRGIRVSIYNAIKVEHVERLVKFMNEFRQKREL